MNNNVLNLLQDKPIVVPRILFNNYKRLNINEEEFIVIMLIISLGNKIEYNPDIFVNELNIEKYKVMEIINNLISKNILSLDMEKNGRKMEEYISLSLLYDKLLNLIIDNNDEDKEIDGSIFTIFENELGKTLSPMEFEQIKEWSITYKNEELIILALKEAVLNGVSNFRYIDKILDDWNRKGYKKKEDIIKDKSNYRKKKSNIEAFDMDWLNDE